MNTLKNIIERCHQRHREPLRQRKTVVEPAPYNELPYYFTVYCAHGYPVNLHDLEEADISFMPIGAAPRFDQAPMYFDDERFLKPQRASDWPLRLWYSSWGISILTGIPSQRYGTRWHDINFKYDAICAAPEEVYNCIETLVHAVANPLLTMSKSGGLRFSCRIRDYLHPNTEEEKSYIYKHTPTSENSYQNIVYLDILGDKGCNRWDARYEILLGNLLDPPVISKEVLFNAIDTLRDKIHEPAPTQHQNPKLSPKSESFIPDSHNFHILALAGQAFLKRGYVYIGQDNGYYQWKPSDAVGENTYVLLWKSEGTVWIRASTPDIGLPTEPVSITDLWDDTGILPPPPANGLPVSDKMLAVREGKLSPLAIKRLQPVLDKSEHTKKQYSSYDENTVQIQRVFDQTARIVGLTTETGAGKTHTIENYVLNGGTISLNAPFKIVEKVDKHFQNQNIPFSRWRARKHRWDQVKDIPYEERMATPFQYGNVCEDYERCYTLEQRGGEPNEIICPECPIYTECQQRGYLSQTTVLKHNQVQMSGTPHQFFDPIHAEVVMEMLEQDDNMDRLCIIDDVDTTDLFFECQISKNTLEEWNVNWRGDVLGNFAHAILNALNTKNDQNDSAVRRIHAVVQAFQKHEDILVRQMCEVNVRGRVIDRGIVDAETDKELARFSIAFQAGVTAYIPLDKNAEDILKTKGLPFFALTDFQLDQDMNIPMQMTQAIQLGVLNTETLENIQQFPTVCRYPNWTFWHQLKHFFEHYIHDAAAPMILYHKTLRFWVPPILHPSVNRLLLMSSTLSEQLLHKAFPHEDVEFNRIEPATWVQGNQVFQIRTDTYPSETLLDFDNNWGVPGMSKLGQHIFLRILSEIKRDTKVKHAIISYFLIAKQMADIAKEENVSIIRSFQMLDGLENAFEEAQVVWIVGTPYWKSGYTWRRAQILFGSDEVPLSYEIETEPFRYKDERVQHVSEQHVTSILSKLIGMVGLNRFPNKRVMLITSFSLPDIINRPETVLFDWEDFEIAGNLDKLVETITTRQRYEQDRDNLTFNSSREKVEQVLGCSRSSANRLLRKLGGGRLRRVPFQDQIFSLLADGEKKTADLIEVIQGHPNSVKNELKRLLETGEIVKVRRGVYAIPETKNN